MRVVVKKWGSNASVRIPAGILKAARLGLGDAASIREEGGRIVIEPIAPRAYDLAQLLTAITPDNVHSPADFGAPVGKELL